MSKLEYQTSLMACLPNSYWGLKLGAKGVMLWERKSEPFLLPGMISEGATLWRQQSDRSQQMSSISVDRRGKTGRTSIQGTAEVKPRMHERVQTL